jgi:hypothetical protein
MAKPNRGSNIRTLFARGRGECPVCKRERVKVLYEQEAEGQKFKICKTCRAAIKNGKKKLPVVIVEKPAEPEVKATAAEPDPQAAQATDVAQAAEA